MNNLLRHIVIIAFVTSMALSVTILPVFAFVGEHAFRVHSQSRSTVLRAVKVRDWQPQDLPEILALLQTTSDDSFDPEGPISLDCADQHSIEESYGEDGCFLVAVSDDDSIVGTAGLVVGTSVQYMKSGASMSSPTITGAIRRVCCNESDNHESCESLEALLADIEKRAAALAADELIILAYPSNTRTKPGPALLEKLQYRQLPAQLKGADAIQYSKNLKASDLC